MSKELYKLINPHIDGSMNLNFKGENAISAADETWNSLSKHLINNVPKFAFSLEKSSDGSLHHFVVSEMVGGNKNVNFSIDELKLNMTEPQEQSFKQFINESASKRKSVQDGGARRHRYDDDDDSSLSSSSSSEERDLYEKLKIMKMQSKPISYWWYNPAVYGINNLYVPTFKAPSSPYVQLNLNSARWS